jgi:hypothetical protein
MYLFFGFQEKDRHREGFHAGIKRSNTEKNFSKKLSALSGF